MVVNNYNESISVVDTTSGLVWYEHDLRPYFTGNEGVSGAVGGTFPFAVVVKGNGIAYVSGMTCRGVDDAKLKQMDEYEQAKVIFGKIKGMVEAAGGAMADVVKVTIYVTDIKNNTKVWKARAEIFKGNFPASTLVEVSALAAPEILVEIEAIAHIGKGSR